MQRSDKDYRTYAMEHAVYAEYHQRLATRYQEKGHQQPECSSYYQELATLNEQLAEQQNKLAEHYLLLVTMPTLLLVREIPAGERSVE